MSTTPPVSKTSRPSKRGAAAALALFAYLFFLSIEAMGEGMKVSFKASLSAYLEAHAADFTELVSFVIGVLGTSLVQSSSTVTAMAVRLTQEGIVPLMISIGIVHGANLGTSVTSSLVAFAASTHPTTGNPLRDLWQLVARPRRPGFHRAVSTAVVHGLFNAILVTLILLALELPFGLIHRLAEASALGIGRVAAQGSWVLEVLEWFSPGTYTEPVVDALLAAGAPGWVLVPLAFLLLFASLRGFARTMSGLLVGSRGAQDPTTLGEKLLGRHPMDTFLRGLGLTILVQSSSATTSMVVPLAAMGLFSLRQILPFILGANIGTTTTALLAASASLGEPGFEAGMTIALAHFYLNTLAVLLVVAVPPLQTSVLGATLWLADAAERVPGALLGYLGAMTLLLPGVVYVLPNAWAWGLLGALVAGLVVGPHLYLRRRVQSTDLAA